MRTAIILVCLLSISVFSEAKGKSNWCSYSIRKFENPRPDQGIDDKPTITACSCKGETPSEVMTSYPDYKMISKKEDPPGVPVVVVLKYRELRNINGLVWQDHTVAFFKNADDCKTEANSEKNKIKAQKQKEQDELNKFR